MTTIFSQTSQTKNGLPLLEGWDGLLLLKISIFVTELPRFNLLLDTKLYLCDSSKELNRRRNCQLVGERETSDCSLYSKEVCSFRCSNLSSRQGGRVFERKAF